MFRVADANIAWRVQTSPVFPVERGKETTKRIIILSGQHKKAEAYVTRKCRKTFV